MPADVNPKPVGATMTSLVRIIFCSLAVAVAPFALQADEAAKADPRIELARKIPGAKPDDLRVSPIPGMFELTRGADIAYVSADGKYAIAGDLYDIKSNDNLSETKRRNVRMQLLSAVPEAEMLVFSPQNPKYTVTVFTDVDCGYCRKLHSQMAEYNRLGIRVRYLFYPRSGPDTESWEKAEEVWCAKDRNAALTRAKLGQEISGPKICKGSPVARDYELGKKFSIGGTPAIVLEDGELLPGYLPPAMLAAHLRGG
jgi:thiol:disulfide interchange protein DsbC